MNRNLILKRTLKEKGYKLGKLCGEGGTAEIFSLGKNYILKLFDETLSHSVIMQEYETNVRLYSIDTSLFLRPVELIPIEIPASLNNTTLVRTFGMIIEKGESINTSNFTLPDIVKLATDISQSLRTMHKAGFIHSDITINNILKKAKNYILIDFGVTHQSASSTTRINPLFYGISAYYAPPEALVERNRKFSVRGDIYSLGIVLRQLITKNVEYNANELNETELVELKKRMTKLRPENTAFFSNGHSDSLIRICNIINKCTEYNRENRYFDANELLSDLLELQTDKQSFPRRPQNWHTKITDCSELNDDEYKKCLSLIRDKQYYDAQKILKNRTGNTAYRLMGEIYYLTNDTKQALDSLFKCKNDNASDFIIYTILKDANDERSKNIALCKLKKSSDAAFPPAQFEYGKLLNKNELIIASAKYYLRAYVHLSKLVYDGTIYKDYLYDIKTDKLTNSLEDLIHYS